MIKKSLILLVLVLVMFSFFVSAADEPQVVKGKIDSTTDGFWGYRISSYWDKTKEIAVKPFVWTRDSVLYPIIGKQSTWYGWWVNFVKLFFVGVLGSVLALFILKLLSIAGFKIPFLDVIVGDVAGLKENLTSWKKPIAASAVFGFFYATLFNIPILNRILEIITLQIFTHLLGDVSEFISRIVLLSLAIIIAFFAPALIMKLLEMQSKHKAVKAIHLKAAMTAMQHTEYENIRKRI